MADNNEEEYLDSLLKSMVDNINEADLNKPYESEEDSSEGSYDSSEDDDMAMLSRMLLEDHNIPFDVDLDSRDESVEDLLVEPLDDILGEGSVTFEEDVAEDNSNEAVEEQPDEAKPAAVADEIDFLSSDFNLQIYCLLLSSYKIHSTVLI